MKAFQLKIMVKNSHPPVWRRAVVPVGITFSQLSMILNEVMGYEGPRPFEFGFYHLQLSVMENAAEQAECVWDRLEASKAYVREYLEQNEWFNYVCVADCRLEHRVTVEEVLEECALDHPQVLKYKDAGVYDLDAVNESLQTKFFYRWEKGEKRSQAELYREHADGKYGLNAAKKDQNKAGQEIRSERHRAEDALMNAAELFREKSLWDEKVSRVKLADIFRDYLKEDVQGIAKDKGLRGISSYNKEELIEKLVEHMMKKEEIERYFLCMHEYEVKAFEKAMKNGGVYQGEEVFCIEEAFGEPGPDGDEGMTMLYQAAYITLVGMDQFVVPVEVMQQYRKLNTSAFKKRRKTRSYVRSCLEALGYLYGIAPVDVVWKMVRTNPDMQITREELCAEIESLPGDVMPFVLKKETVYYGSLFSDDRGLTAVQGRKEFYIPTMQEIQELSRRGYLPENPQLKNLMTFWMEKMGVDEEDAEFAGSRIQSCIQSGGKMQEISDIMESVGIRALDKAQLEEMIGLIFELWNNTRMVVNRGFTPLEMTQLYHDDSSMMWTKPQAGNDGNIQEAKKIKIYPNDPCPCGSGKKYKKCCGAKK